MSLKTLGSVLSVEPPITFYEVAKQVDQIVERLGGEVNSRQILALTVVLLERIEQLEKRLEANGIYQ